MIDCLLNSNNIRCNNWFSTKSIIAIFLILSSIGLPQIVHIVGGKSAGIIWLPMYMPIILASCIMGTAWGVSIAVISPILSTILTSMLGEMMPSLVRLPFMVVELFSMALITGMLSKLMYRKIMLSFIIVPIAILIGRGTFALLVYFTNATSLIDIATMKQQIIMGKNGVIAQILVIPVLLLLFNHLFDRSTEKWKNQL